MNPNTTLQKADNSEVKFIPFGGNDPIKLSIGIVKNLVAVPTRSGKYPTDKDCLKFVALCQTQRLNPLAGDAFLIGYDGKDGPQFSLITAHVAFLKRAETCPDFEGMESGIIILGEDDAISEREGDFHLSTEKVVGGWAKVFRKGRTHPTYRRLRMERFNKGFAQWRDDPAGMIVKCAESDALRSTFPTLLGGLYTGGEIIEMEPVKVTTDAPSFGRAALKDSQPEREHLRQAAAKPEPDQESARETHPDDADSAQFSANQKPPAPQEPTTTAPSAAVEFGDYMVEAGVSFDDFTDWCVTTGYFVDAKNFAQFDQLPEAFVTKLRADSKAMAKLVKIYSKKAAQ